MNISMLKDKEVKKVATKQLKIEYRFFSKDRERQFKTAAVRFGKFCLWL